MKKFLANFVANCAAFYYATELFESTIEEQYLKDHAKYALAALLLFISPAAMAMKHKICGSKKQSRSAHGLLQFLGAGCLIYSVYSVLNLYAKFGKAHAWNFSEEDLKDNLLAKGHGLIGFFLTGVISLLVLVVPLKMGPGTKDEVLLKEGPQHAIAGKVIFTLLSCAAVFGSFLALGFWDVILCVCIFVNWASVVFPDSKKEEQVKETKKGDSKKEN